MSEVSIQVQETVENVEIVAQNNVIEVNITRQSGGGGGAVESVNGQTGDVVLDADDISDASTANKFVTESEKTAITHENRSTLDLITEAFTTALKNAYDGAVAWIITNGANILNHISSTSNPHNTTASQVGAYTTGQVDTLLNGKENTITAGTTSQYYRGDKTFQTLNVSAVSGLQTALDLKSNFSTTPRILANDESGITSTGIETVCATVQIDNLGTNWAMDLWLDIIKNGTASAMLSRVYINNTPNLIGSPISIATSQSDINTRRVVPLQRKLSYKSGVLKTNSNNFSNDFINLTPAKTEIAIDLNTQQVIYLVFTIQRIGASGDTVTALRHQVIFYPTV